MLFFWLGFIQFASPCLKLYLLFPVRFSLKTKRKFSSFFKSLVIELDKDLYGPDNHLVEVSINSLDIRQENHC